jgi:single-strand DNA-binding protein
MGSLNRVILLGNLGRDAELKYTASGAAVCSFSMATTEKWKGRDGQAQEKTEWHRVVLWGKSAESLAEYLTKGKQVAVEGRIETRTYDKDGEKRYSTEIKADRVILLGGSGGSAPASSSRSVQAAKASMPDSAPIEDGGFLDEDPPF